MFPCILALHFPLLHWEITESGVYMYLPYFTFPIVSSCASSSKNGHDYSSNDCRRQLGFGGSFVVDCFVFFNLCLVFLPVGIFRWCPSLVPCAMVKRIISFYTFNYKQLSSSYLLIQILNTQPIKIKLNFKYFSCLLVCFYYKIYLICWRFWRTLNAYLKMLTAFWSIKAVCKRTNTWIKHKWQMICKFLEARILNFCKEKVLKTPIGK